MKVRIEFKTDNAAFDGDWGVECARILRKLADTIYWANNAEEMERESIPLVDYNGNTVGSMIVEEG